MKVLRIFGIVAAVHALAFLLIMANPGCSTKTKPQPAPAVTEAAPAQMISAPSTLQPVSVPTGGELSGGEGIVAPHYSPTRPNTPASSALQAESPKDFTPATTVTVGRGDSLWSISKKHGVPVTELAAANNLKTGATLRIGQKLIVPTKGSSVSVGKNSRAASAKTSATAAVPKNGGEAPAPKFSANGGSKHVVKAGETLVSIARIYHVRASDIAVANNISNPATIRPGRELVIPGGASSRSGAATAASSPASSPAPVFQPAAQPEAAPATQTPAQNANPVMPTIGVPPPEQDLDAGLKNSAPENIPVIKIDDPSSAPAK